MLSSIDFRKILAMLSMAAAAVALYCYGRVDRGMSQEQINQQLDQWLSTVSTCTVLIWSQIVVASIAGVAYRIWRHRADTARGA